MCWGDYERLGLGLLNLSQEEFLTLTVYEVFVKLVAKHDERISREVRDRRNLMYHVAPYWSGVGKLKHGWQLWHIPEVDGDIKEFKGTTARYATEEEKYLYKNRPKGWLKRIKELADNRGKSDRPNVEEPTQKGKRLSNKGSGKKSSQASGKKRKGGTTSTRSK